MQVQNQNQNQGQLSSTTGANGNTVISNPAYRPYYSQPSTALGPQQLENVAKDEDPIYGPLGRARGKIERGLKGDEEISPDLGQLLEMQSESSETIKHHVPLLPKFSKGNRI
jgi:nuclear pore complex protein Nup155